MERKQTASKFTARFTAGAASLLRKASSYKKAVQAHRGAARRFSKASAARPQKRNIVASKRNLAPSVRKRLPTKLDHASPELDIIP